MSLVRILQSALRISKDLKEAEMSDTVLEVYSPTAQDIRIKDGILPPTKLIGGRIPPEQELVKKRRIATIRRNKEGAELGDFRPVD